MENEEKIIKALRSVSPYAEPNSAFIEHLSLDLRNRQKKQAYVPHSRSFNFALFSTLATVILAVPLLIIGMGLLSDPRTEDAANPDFSTVDRTEQVLTSDLVDLRVEFASYLNSKDSVEIAKQLADEVYIDVAKTFCCGELSKSEALLEVMFQLEDKSEYDFSLSNETLLNVTIDNTDYLDFDLGVNAEGFVVGYSYTEDFLVSRIIFTHINNLVNEQKAEAASLVIENINQLDKEGLEESLAQEIDLVLYNESCCNIIDKNDALAIVVNRLQNTGSIDFSGTNKDLNFAKSRYPAINAYRLGLSDTGEIVGFSLDSELLVNKIFVAKLDELVPQKEYQCDPASDYQGGQADLDLVVSEQSWKSEFAGSESVIGIDSNYIVVQDKLLKIGIEDGLIKASIPITNNGDESWYETSKGVLAVSESSMNLFDKVSGELRWKRENSWQATYTQSISPTFLCEMLVVHVYSEVNRISQLEAYSLIDGTKLWTRILQGMPEKIFPGKEILIFDSSANLYALSPANGNLVWRKSLRVGQEYSVQFVSGYTLFANSKILSLYNNADGALVWSKEGESRVLSASVYNSDLIIVFNDGRVEVLDLETGRSKSENEIEKDIQVLYISAESLGYVVGNTFKAYNLTTGETDFTFKLPSETNSLLHLGQESLIVKSGDTLVGLK